MSNSLSRRACCVALLFAAACGDSTAPRRTIKPFDNLDQANITGELKLFGGGGQWTINSRLVVHNTTTEPRLFDWSRQCPSRIEVYRDINASTPPVWTTLVQQFGCKVPVVPDTIAPGDSLVLDSPTATTNEILSNYGSPNPPGQYFFYFALPTPLASGGVLRGLAGYATLGA